MPRSRRSQRPVAARLAQLEDTIAALTEAQGKPTVPELAEGPFQDLLHFLDRRLQISEEAYICQFPEVYRRIENVILPPEEALRRQMARRRALVATGNNHSK
jgi:hypothetical protein